MATAKENATMVINVEFDDKQAARDYENSLRAAERKTKDFAAEQKRSAQRMETDVAAIRAREAAKTAAQKERIETQSQVKLAAQAKLAAQKQEQAITLMQAKELERRRIQHEREQQRIASGHLSWSKKMVAGIDSIGNSIKGLAIAWATIQVSNIVSGSLDFAGGLRDAASGVNLTTREFYALTSALRDAGVPMEKIDQMLTRVSQLRMGGADEKQKQILNRLGINAETLSTIQIVDELLLRINERTITQVELGDIVGARVVPSWNRLAHEIKSTSEAIDRYSLSIGESDIDRLDEISASYQTFLASLKLGFSRAFIEIADSWTYNFEANTVAAVDRTEKKIKQASERLDRFVSDAQMEIARERADVTTPTLVGPPNMSDAEKAYWNEVNAKIERGREDTARKRLDYERELADLLKTRPVSPTGQTIPRATIAPGTHDFDPIQQSDSAIVGLPRTLDQAYPKTQALVAQFATMEDRAEQVANHVNTFANSGKWAVMQAGADAFTNILSLQAQYLQNEIAALDAVSQRERQRWNDRSAAMRAAGLETSAAYRNEARAFEEAEKKREQKSNALKAKAFEQDKTGRTVSTIMATAQAVMQAWATLAWPFNMIIAALAASSGAAQIATIQSQQNPYKYREGGWVNGPPSDTNMIATTGGEYVVEKNAAARNADALKYINSGGSVSPSGGVTLVIQGDVYQRDNWVEDVVIPALIKAQRRGINISR